MYAIIKAGGKQYKVAENDIIEVNRLAASEGDEIVLNEVLLLNSDSGVKIGSPFVEGASVLGKVTRHYQGRKINGFTYKPKKNVHRRYGHRQQLTSVAIVGIKE